MNLAAVLTRAAASSPDAPALWWRDEVTSHGQLAEEAARLAGGLRSLGVAPGDRVAIACANTPVFVVTYLAALHAGAVAVPVNPLSAPEELARELGGTGVAVAVLDAVSLPAFDAVRAAGALEAVTPVVAGLAEPAGAHSWEEHLGAEPMAMVERADDDLAVLAHTSGTSGPSRAAMLTHRNLAANLEQSSRHPTMHVEPGDRVLAVLPFFHVFGLNVVLGTALAAGAELIVVERFEPVEALELVARLAVTVVPGVPPMFAAWTALPDATPGALASVRLAVSGAAPLPSEVQRAFLERFGVTLHQGYGLTEASPVVTTTPAGIPPREGSIGVPVPGVEVRLVDRDGADALVGDPGEIWVRGDNVFVGYLDDREATARVLTPDGWLRTGDVAVADDDGVLSIVDRSKDLVIVSGFNVYPMEVEEVLTRHPLVREAAVVGVPDAHTGEAVRAFVVLEPGGSLDQDELMAFCGQYLARYKCPTRVDVVEQLPRGLAGKLLRRELGPPGR